MAKAWGVPIDHEWVKNTSPAQWRYYAANLVKDDEERNNLIRSILVEAGWRLRPEVAIKIQEAEQGSTVKVNTQFEEQIKQKAPEMRGG